MALQEELEKQGIWLFKYRGSLPFIPFVIGILLFIRINLYPQSFFLNGSAFEIYYQPLCLLISLFGLGIRAYAVGHSPQYTSGRNTEEQVAGSLNTTGLYSVVRHPLYLGNFFMWIGPALLTGNFWFIIAFCFFYWIYYERIMFAEEQFLRRKFGNIYTNWAEQTPAFLPNFKPFRKPNLPMSWKKILKNEKTGLLLVFIIFSAFNICGELIQHKTNYDYFIIIPCVLILFMYPLLKYLSKRTKLLDEVGR